MIPAGGDPLHWLFLVTGGILGVAALASLIRLMIGPTLADRVVALDLLGFLIIGVFGAYAITAATSSLLAVGLVAALILFLGTTAFAIYVELRRDR